MALQLCIVVSCLRAHHLAVVDVHGVAIVNDLALEDGETVFLWPPIGLVELLCYTRRLCKSMIL